MKTINTANLTDVALDWAVEVALGRHQPPFDEFTRVWLSQRRYSSDWAQGGPIIDREICSLRHAERFEKRGLWLAFAVGGKRSAMGKTALEAAMRCFVASKLGDTVEVPEELL